MSSPQWPFRDPERVAVFTSKSVLSGAEWIAYVTHDADDGAWQFHGEGGPTSEANAAVVSLRSIFQRDPSIGALADLPLGWRASRETKDSPWRRKSVTG